MGRIGVKFSEGRECRWLGIMGGIKSIRVMIGYFVEVCKRSDQKVNTGKMKVVVLGGEKGLVCQISEDERQLNHVAELKYLRLLYKMTE